jgi:3-methyladenine DNA glycosylase AlkC
MPFADELIGQYTAQSLTHAIHAAAPDAELTALRAAPGQIGPLSLRERADLLRDALLADLPGDYASLARTVRIARDRDRAPHFTGWLIWPVTSALASRAVQEGTAASFDDAMALLADLTPRLTSEFAIRTLLRHDLDRALGIIVGGWTGSADADLRRLASEGTRPYLPWSVRVPEIMARPGVTSPILDALYRDESEYVRRSVANHLNDLSRDHPEVVVATARRWLDSPDATTERLVRHGLRTLVKRGHPGALELLGFAPATLEVDGPRLDRDTVPFGGSVRFTASIRNTGTDQARLAIDYVVHHRKANGGQTGKTFKLTMCTLAPGEETEVTREHSFRPITTRRYYPGRHAISLQINGVGSARADFELAVPDRTGELVAGDDRPPFAAKEVDAGVTDARST